MSTKVWYCANCGYEVTSRGRCHACGERLVASSLPELESGPDDDEVGYRLDMWDDQTRARLIEALISAGVLHRFEDEELVILAVDEAEVDRLVATVTGTAAATTAATSNRYAGYDDEEEGDDEQDTGEEGRAVSRHLYEAAKRLRDDPTDMQADVALGEASAAVFTLDYLPGFDEDHLAAVGRVTRRLLGALGSDEALEDEIRHQAEVLCRLIAPSAGEAEAEAEEDRARARLEAGAKEKGRAASLPQSEVTPAGEMGVALPSTAGDGEPASVSEAGVTARGGDGAVSAPRVDEVQDGDRLGAPALAGDELGDGETAQAELAGDEAVEDEPGDGQTTDVRPVNGKATNGQPSEGKASESELSESELNESELSDGELGDGKPGDGQLEVDAFGEVELDDEEMDDEEEGAGELVYELAEWLPEQRVELSMLLESAGIAYNWDATDLTVAEENEDEVDGLFEQVHGALDEDDEARYHSIEELFGAVDRLANDPGDEERRRALLETVGVVELPTPVGLDDSYWWRVRSQGHALVAAIEHGSRNDEVSREAALLAEMLHEMV